MGTSFLGRLARQSTVLAANAPFLMTCAGIRLRHRRPAGIDPIPGVRAAVWRWWRRMDNIGKVLALPIPGIRGRLGTIVPAASLADPRGAILLPAATGPILVSIDRLLGSPYGVG